MPYLKSTLIGVVALLLSAVVYVSCMTVLLLRRYPPPPGVEVAIALGPLFTRPLFWVIGVAAFAIGFYWEFRRA